MTALALGIVPKGARLPPGLRAVPAGASIALALAPARSSTPDARLRACVAIHATAPAFLPWPPRHAVAARAARDRVLRASDALGSALAEAEGAAELVVRLALPVARPGPTPPDGRGWLAARASERDRGARAQRRAERWIASLARSLSADLARPEAVRGALCATLRLPHASEMGLHRRVGTAIDGVGPPPCAQSEIAVTGPWPLFRFSPLAGTPATLAPVSGPNAEPRQGPEAA